MPVCNKLVDYLALGLPVVTTESAALRRYVDDSEVVYVEPKNAQALAEAILALYRDPVRCDALGVVGHAAYLDDFVWERTKHDYLGAHTHNSACDTVKRDIRGPEAERNIA